MNTGEYLSVLVSIIVGLGLSHLLGSVGKLLSRRRRVRPYMPSVLAAVIVFLAHVQFWWGSFEFGERIESNFFAFLVFLLTPILLYLIAVLVLPGAGPGRQRRGFAAGALLRGAALVLWA